MKKSLLFLGVIGLGSFTVILLRENVMPKSKINIGTDNIEKVQQKNMLSMMLETEAGSGNYELTTKDSWPTEGYIFNSTLSKCENGSTLSWDDTKNVILMTGNLSDKCYVYFDKVKPIAKPIINNVIFDADGSYSGVKLDYVSENGIQGVYLKIGNGSYSNYDRFFDDERQMYTYYNKGICPGETDTYCVYMTDNNNIKSNTICDIYTSTCFPSGTKILTKKGLKNIENIKVNDEVYSFNEFTEKNEIKKVTKTFQHLDTEIYYIKLENELIKVTPHHRFYIQRNNNFYWVDAKNLKLTDKLFNKNKELIKITNISYKKENNKVYNFEVENNHNYFVSKKSILVHNAKEPCP